MGNLYLDSGESIIQTTDRISVNSIASDLLLTTRRLILVDSTHRRLDPLMISFATIVSLQGGWNSSGEPVITLTLMDPNGGGTQLLDLVFFQQSGEHRKEECDGWVQYLMDHIVLARQETIRADVPTSAREPGIHPSVRRWVAPDMIRPHTTIASSRPVPSGEVMTPVQTDALEVIEEEEGSTAPPTLFRERVAGSSPDSVQEPDGIVFPFVPEEPADLPGAETSAVPDTVIQTTVPEQESETPETNIPPRPDEPTDLPVAETSAAPDAVIPIAVPEQESETPETNIPPRPDEPTDLPVAETSAVPDAIIQTTVPEQGLETPETILPPLPNEPTDLPVAETSAVPDAIIQTTVPEQGLETPETILPSGSTVFVADEPAAQGTPPPSPGSTCQTKLPVLAIGLIILAIAGSVGFFALYMAGGDAGSHNAGTIPTLTQSPTPTLLPHLIIPANGVWVRVGCNSTFVGWVGNPGSLKMVSGTGDQFYKIQNSNDLVQVSFQKQEYSGDILTVEIYNQGKLITHRTVTAPRGTIDFIIDANTGNPPGLPTDLT
jgi:hypothetical protein